MQKIAVLTKVDFIKQAGILKKNVYYYNNVKQARKKETEKLIAQKKIKKAGVLVVIFENNNCPYILLTRRSENLKSHTSEVALPGGKADPSDASIVETAIRECEEEIGLNRKHVDVIGVLQPTFAFKSMLMVYPVIATIKYVENIKLMVNKDEVEDVFAVPLEIFLLKNIHEWRKVQFKNQFWALNLFKFNRNDPEIGDSNIEFLGASDSHQSDKFFNIFGMTAMFCIYSAMLYFDKMPDIKFRQNSSAKTLYEVFSEKTENLYHELNMFSEYKSKL